jgi:transcriptional regulator
MPEAKDARSELLQGTLDLLILRTLAAGAMHGWGISQRIQQLSGDVFAVNQGSLYPALHRLERQRWIRAEWKLSDRNQRARVYQLTPAGRKHLVAERSRWEQMSAVITTILERRAPRPGEA